MIISDEHRFAFVHIPKCAGTSIRKGLRSIDTAQVAFDRIDAHPVLGMVHYGHLTLDDLATHFPAEFDKITSYRSVAILRDPVDRFFSALFQRLREFKRLDQSQITSAVVEGEARDIVKRLREGGRLELEYVHFTRQSAFIDHGGRRVVESLYPVDQLQGAFAFIESCTGVRIDAAVQENQTLALRAGALTPVVRHLRKPYTALVPLGLRDRVRQRLVRAGLYGRVKGDQLTMRNGALLRFIEDHYREDFELHASAQ